MKPKLFESLITAPSEAHEIYEKLKLRSQEHPYFKRYTQMGIKEGLFSDSTNALGLMHNNLVEAAYPELIGRNLINVVPTTETMERFPLDVDAVAYRYAEGAITRLSGKKNSVVDVYTDVLAESSEAWTREFLEDATWNVMNNMTGKVGRALGQDETERIIALYGAVAAGDLASGAALAGGGAVFSWAGVLALHQAVRSQNWRPNVLAINEMQLHQLLNDESFKNSVYLPSSATDMAQGSIGNVLGMSVQASTLVPNGTAYAIDTRVASVMLMRRDVTVEDWEDVKSGKYGVRATTRFGFGILRSNAIAKMTNIKQTLT
jgi:HK97 family phage major capsid protein